MIQYTAAARLIMFRICTVTVMSPSWVILGALTGTNVHVSGFQEEPGGRQGANMHLHRKDASSGM